MLSTIPFSHPHGRSLGEKEEMQSTHVEYLAVLSGGVVDGLCVLGEGIQSAATLWIGKIKECFKDLSLTT